MLDVVTAGHEEDEGGDGGEGRGLLDLHEQGAESEAEALGYQHAEEEHEEGEEEGGGARGQAAHPIEDDGEGGGEGELHREVTGRAREEIGGEAVHSGGLLLAQHRTLLRERKHRVVQREEAPKHREEEDQRRLHTELQTYISFII